MCVCVCVCVCVWACVFVCVFARRPQTGQATPSSNSRYATKQHQKINPKLIPKVRSRNQ